MKSRIHLAPVLLSAIASLIPCGCTTPQPPRATALEKNFPVSFGDARDRARRKLGPMDESAEVWDQFRIWGVQAFYDFHDDAFPVDGFVLGDWMTGAVTQVSAFGVRIGDNYESAVHSLGAPLHTGVLAGEHPVAVWRKGDSWLSLLGSGNGPTGTVRAATWCQEKCYAFYDIIIAITVAELRAGKRPSFLEDLYEPDIALDDPRFQRPYAMSPTELFPYGGATSILLFEDSKPIFIWIYPLAWVEPRIRMMMDKEDLDSLGQDDDSGSPAGQ